MGSEGDYTANADIKYAYYSEASRVMVALPKTSDSLLIMTIVPASAASKLSSDDGSDGSFFCINGGSVSGTEGGSGHEQSEAVARMQADLTEVRRMLTRALDGKSLQSV